MSKMAERQTGDVKWVRHTCSTTLSAKVPGLHVPVVYLFVYFKLV